MAITVKYFASLRELVGRREEVVAAGSCETVDGLWRRVNPQCPRPAHALAAVNLEPVPLEHPVEDGDEVAFFPPVTGG